MDLHKVITGPGSIAQLKQQLDEVPMEPQHEIIIRPWDPPGSTPQLKTIYKWYSEIAKYKPEDDHHGWRRYCKYNIGVPILLRDQDDGILIAIMAAMPLPHGYEMRIAAMDYVDVVSVMSREQRTEYMEGILKHPFFHDVRFTIPPKKNRRQYAEETS